MSRLEHTFFSSPGRFSPETVPFSHGILPQGLNPARRDPKLWLNFGIALELS